MMVGFACAFRFESAVGVALLAAAANVLFGEVVGPASLRAALTRAGEIVEAPAAEDTAS